jgi:twitching motility protein PilT
MHEKLFQLLSREDVKELALQAERPPCVLIGEQYSPVLKRNLSEEEVLEVLVEADGRTEVLGLMSGSRRWDFDHPELGKIRVSAGYSANRLQARFKRAEPAAATSSPKSAASVPETQPRAAKASIPKETWDQLPVPPTPHASVEPLASRPPVPGPVVARAPEPAAPRPELSAPPPKFVAPVKAPVAPVASAPAGAAAELFEALLELARSKRASDLHILADRPPMLRVAGDLVPLGEPLPAAIVEEMLLARVPESARRDLDQHGACDFALLHPTLGRFRANVTRQRTGYKLTARPIGETVQTLEELGLPPSIGLATHHHQGLIVCTGPTGHGKTTTLAAIVDLINREHSHHIITVEDPIEYVHPRKQAMLSQRQVGLHTKTFAAALKGSLREDPDVIVVGELRDTETVRMALSASETGHLVISTMNTPSAAKAIERIIDLFPPSDQPQVRMTLAGGLRLIVSQRLLPTADRTELCAAAELLPGTPTLWALIRDNKTFQIPSLQQRGKALGIIRLDDSLADLVRSGRTTLEIAKEYAEAPEQLEGLVNPKPKVQEPIAPGQDTNAAKFGKDMLSKAGKLFGNERK